MSFNPVIGRLVKVSDHHRTTHYLVNSNRNEGAISALKRSGRLAEGQHFDVSAAEGGELNEMFLGEVRKTDAFS
jgi:hypothetical protein